MRRFTPATRPAHEVHFYGSEFPARSVARYLNAGMKANEAAIMVATPQHTELIHYSLIELGASPSELRREGMLRSVSTDDVMEKHRAGEEDVIRKRIGVPMMECLKASPSGRIRVYGEFVNVLIAAGEAKLCFELERLSNELIKEHPMRIYCGYSTESFPERRFANDFETVCELHGELRAHSLDTYDWHYRLLSLCRRKHRHLH
jgi:MEDS: MEthanogen/methylotroph, DcmR Sensory domain